MLEIKDLFVSYGMMEVLHGISLNVQTGELVSVIGPNGAGKSTCVSAIAQCAPYTGEVLAGGGDARRMKPAGFSREITMIDYGITSDREKFVTEISIPVN